MISSRYKIKALEVLLSNYKSFKITLINKTAGYTNDEI